MTGTVGVVLHEATLGGASRAALAPVGALEDEGWRFTFWVPSPGPLADDLRAAGHRVAGAPRLLRYSPAALREPPGAVRRLASVPGYGRAFGAWLRRERPDVVHANTLLTLPEALLARALRRPTLLHVHEMLPRDVRGRSAALLARRCDRAVCVSGACADALGALGVPADVVRPGVVVPATHAARAVAGTPGTGAAATRRLVIGALGTVSPRKGSDAVVRLAERLADRADVELRLVGPLAPGRDEAWARGVRGAAADAGVRWSTTDEPAAELATWDVLVHPARADPFPLVILEALALGVPVVAYAVDGIPEQLGPDAGVCVPPEDLDALERAVRGLLDDADRRAALSDAGRARVAARFDLGQQARGIAAAYDRTIAAHRVVARNGTSGG